LQLGSAQTHWEHYSAPPDSIAGFKGPKGENWRPVEREKGREEGERKGKRRGETRPLFEPL